MSDITRTFHERYFLDASGPCLLEASFTAPKHPLPGKQPNGIYKCEVTITDYNGSADLKLDAFSTAEFEKKIEKLKKVIDTLERLHNEMCVALLTGPKIDS